MRDCIIPKYGDMLHGWELSMLPEDEQQEFELHLFECDFCAEQAQQFLKVSRWLREDQAFRPSAQEFPDTQFPERGRSGFLGNRITRMLLVAAALLLVAVPAYRLVFPPAEHTESLQLLKLVPIRGSDNAIVERSRGGQLEIQFYAEGAEPEREYRIVIASQNGAIVYTEGRFRHFQSGGNGTLTLPVSVLPTGILSLTITSARDTLSVLQKYFFRVQ